jgi:hypothetical protein
MFWGDSAKLRPAALRWPVFGNRVSVGADECFEGLSDAISMAGKSWELCPEPSVDTLVGMFFSAVMHVFGGMTDG